MSSIRVSPLHRGFIGLTAAVLAILFMPGASHASVPGFQTVDLSPSPAQKAEVKGKAAKSGINGRIVGGADASIDSFPFQVLLTANGQPFCGGSLIHPMIIITASHCLVDANKNYYNFEFGAIAGRTQTSSGGEVLSLSNGYSPNEYNPATFDNDYAFLTLSSATSRPTIKIAGPDERAIWKAGRNAIVTGYGAISEGGDGSPVLKALNVPILDDSACAGSLSYGVEFHAVAMLCAGFMAGGQDSCKGDSGGPLSAPIDGGGYRLVGVTSFGTGCARPNFPGIYTRVGEATFSAKIAEAVKEIEQGESFPGIYNGIGVVGAGAKPPGCAAAFTRSAVLSAAFTKAGAKSKVAQRSLKAAKAAVKKAKKKSKAKRKAAARKLKTATKRAKTATATLRKAKADAATAASDAGAACN